MSCGVVPSRHIVFVSPLRALRTRLPSLRSVVPSRHLTPKSINVSIFVTTTGTTWDNLKLSFADATEMTRNIIAHELLGNIFFAHELHEWTRIVAMD